MNNVQSLANVVTEEEQNNLKQLYEQKNLCKIAANTAATDLFAKSVFPEVNNEVWKQLWAAARAYSERSAYKGREFPVTSNDAHCVLCLQPRLQNFENFVKNNIQQKYKQIKAKFDDTIGKLSQLQSSLSDIRVDVEFCKNDLDDECLGNKLRAFFIKGKWKLRAMRRIQETDDKLSCISLQELLKTKKTDIQEKISELSSPDRKKFIDELTKEKKELEGKQWVKQHKQDILAEIKRKKEIANLKSLIEKETNSIEISKKSKEIAKALITEKLTKQFEKELKSLELELDVSLKTTGSKGQTKTQVIFNNTKTGSSKRKMSEILSEGEFRAIGLAVFFAELAVTNNQSAIIFDDPVSSLDHMHRDIIAKRLIKESIDRQVIVFTHDIYFSLRLASYCKDYCKDDRTKLTYRHLSKTRSPNLADIKTGICSECGLLKTQNVDQRIKTLRKRLQAKNYTYTKGITNEWEEAARILIKDIRETWELAVENVVSCVTERLAYKVNLEGLAHINLPNEEQLNIMRKEYGLCSGGESGEHSIGQSANRPIPKPDEIERRIDTLDKWNKEHSPKKIKAKA